MSAIVNDSISSCYSQAYVLYLEPLWKMWRDENHLKESKSKSFQGTSLSVQCLRLCASDAGDLGSVPGGGTKIPNAM